MAKIQARFVPAYVVDLNQVIAEGIAPIQVFVTQSIRVQQPLEDSERVALTLGVFGQQAQFLHFRNRGQLSGGVETGDIKHREADY